MPEMLLVSQNVILDVADRERALFQQPHHLARIAGLYVGEPAMTLALVQLHVRDEEAEVLRGYIGQRMGPVLEHALVEALRLAEMVAAIVGNAGVEDVVMAALDHIDGVDLHIAEMGDGIGHRRGTRTERRGPIEPLRTDPDAPCLGFGQRMGLRRAGHGAAF